MIEMKLVTLISCDGCGEDMARWVVENPIEHISHWIISQQKVLCPSCQQKKRRKKK